MFNFLNVLKREFNLVGRDKNILLIILAAPVFYTLFYGTVYVNKTQREIPLAVVDMDNSPESQRLTLNIDAHPVLEVYDNTGNYAEAEKETKEFVTHGLLVIPRGYAEARKNGKSVVLKLTVNATRFLVANEISKAVNDITSDEAAKTRLEYFRGKGYGNETALALSEPVNGDIRPLFNFTETYGDFLLPGLLILILQQTLLIGLSESMAQEREAGLYPEFAASAGGNPFVMASGKGVMYVMIFAVYAFFFFTVDYKIFHLPFEGSLTGLTLITLLYLASVAAFGIFISSFFKKKIVALQITALSSYPVFLISGYSFPSFAMPEYANVLASLIPSTPYLNAYTRITQMGAGLGDVTFEIMHIAGLLIAFTLLAVRRMIKLTKDKTQVQANDFQNIPKDC